MTTLDVTLSTDLQEDLSHQGVWAYAVYFAYDPQLMKTVPFWTPLVDNGTVQSGGSATINLPATLDGGKIYFLIQSQDASQPNDLETLITTESDINWSNAATWDFRYDSFEVTLSNSPNDAGNLTSVNGFGIPMELSVTYDDGTVGSKGYDISGSEMFSKIGAIGDAATVFTYASGPLAGTPRAAISPATAVGLVPPDPAFAASDWDAYIDLLKTSDHDIELSGFFNGAADANNVYHNPGFYSYSLEWDDAGEVFWLVPAENSAIQGYIRLTPDDLADSIYSTLGDADIYTSQDATSPYLTMNTGENNQWGAVLAQFFTGFTGGYYLNDGQSLNPAVTDPVDLDQNINWDPTYAFGRMLSSQGSSDWDDYSEVFFLNSNSYGSGYSDALMQQYAEGGPLLIVSNPDTGQNVSTIDITLFADSEQPTGYVEPVIYNYIAAGSGGYEVPDSTGTPLTLKLNLANATAVLDADTPISLDVLTGTDGSGAPNWQTVAFDVPEGQSPWQVWTLTRGADGYTATLQPGTDQGTGNLLISNFPASDDGVYWYRFNIGSGDTLKTYNFYAEISDGQFSNPLFAGQESDLAIDGLANIAAPVITPTPETVTTLTINFLYGATNTVDPANVVRNPQAPAVTGKTPNAPVAGTVSGDTFTAFPGQTNQVSNTISADAAEVAFGWVGENDSTSATPSWISGYTNKIGALNFAQIGIEQSDGTLLAPLHTNADLDGQWVTGATPLGNGTYTVTMTEFLASDTNFKTPIGTVSSPLTLTVDADEVDLAPVPAAGSAAVAGSAVATGAGGAVAGGLVLDAGPGAAGGNWIDLDVLEAPADPGTTLLVYLATSGGDPVARDGRAGPDVPIADAVLGSVGMIRDDAGVDVLQGSRVVYLPEGHQLRFALDDGNGAYVPAEEVSIERDGDGEVLFSVGGFSVRAATDNTLTSAAVLAGGERATGEALVYLAEGDAITVEVTGSTDGTNRLGFVRMDVDGVTGALSVDGVAYGDTAAFREAVLDNLDSGFSVEAGGTFAKSLSWTVDGETGYYAPVLVTEAGDVFVIGTANPDGREMVRSFGDATFGFEDRTEGEGADFDYNDMVVRLSTAPSLAGPTLGGETAERLVVEGAATVGRGDTFVSFADAGDRGVFGPEFALLVRGTAENSSPRLEVGGTARFEGDGQGVLLVGDAPRVFVSEGGSLSFGEANADTDAVLLETRSEGGGTSLVNDGEILGPVRLDAGDDVVTGTGTFEGPLRTGEGDDRFVYGGEAPLRDVDLGAGDDVFSNEGAAASEVDGGPGDDDLSGGDGDDVLAGGEGDDFVFGNDGDDVIAGNTGFNHLDGGDGADVILADDGDNFVLGGEGADDFSVAADVDNELADLGLVTGFDLVDAVLGLVSPGDEVLGLRDAEIEDVDIEGSGLRDLSWRFEYADGGSLVTGNGLVGFVAGFGQFVRGNLGEVDPFDLPTLLADDATELLS